MREEYCFPGVEEASQLQPDLEALLQFGPLHDNLPLVNLQANFRVCSLETGNHVLIFNLYNQDEMHFHEDFKFHDLISV
jgi:hypothetical protein